MERPPSHASMVFTGFFVLVLTVLLIVFSEHGFRATEAGLRLFFSVVLPSLLPFFIISEILLATGMVNFLGVFFEPLMRPLFDVPGVGSFVFSMGLAAGYPMDAVLTAKFRRQDLVTRIEAERLLAFSNSADPLFLLGAVAVGMFGRPQLGALLAVAHYGSGIVVGMLFRLHGRGAPTTGAEAPSGSLWTRALAALYRARLADQRSLGQVVNEAFSSSVSTLFMIMGFIVLFSVILRVMEAARILPLIEAPVAAAFRLLGLSPHLAAAAVTGLFEIDLGSARAATAHAPLMQRLAVVSAIVAWSGLSVHGQVASVLTDTDIRMGPYVVARMLHAVIAALLTLIAYPLMAPTGLTAALGPSLPTPGAPGDVLRQGLAWSLDVAAVSLGSLVLGAFTMASFRVGRVVWWHVGRR
jgi:sporulation integral membrane protein YlbJ